MEESILAVSLRQAARRIGGSERTVVNLINAKELKSRKIVGGRVIRVNDLLDCLRRDRPTGPILSNGQLNAYEVAGSSPPKSRQWVSLKYSFCKAHAL
jgi:Helix-turn-helix domain